MSNVDNQYLLRELILQGKPVRMQVSEKTAVLIQSTDFDEVLKVCEALGPQPEITPETADTIFHQVEMALTALELMGVDTESFINRLHAETGGMGL